MKVVIKNDLINKQVEVVDPSNIEERPPLVL